MPKAQGNVRVLLVDDHPDTLELQAMVLRKHGYEVETAEDARTAMAIAQDKPLDLVISDIRLPDRDGFALMQDLKQAHGLQGIALTGSAQAEDRSRGAETGFVRYMVKPVPPEQLLDAIKALTSSRNG
ncbi:MAG: response regulator [Phycisphaeraceae bacterium]